MELEKLLGQLYPENGGNNESHNGEIDVEMLDYSYIGKCNNAAELEAILEILK
jgi:hypothetical protein